MVGCGGNTAPPPTESPPITVSETDNNDKHKPKFVRERKRGQKKSEDSHDDGGMQMNM